jgi:hypothetical protein
MFLIAIKAHNKFLVFQTKKKNIDEVAQYTLNEKFLDC